MTTRLFVGDVFARMAELDDHSFDLIVTSPPFLALRSYLPDDHPDKHKEIGSEATPADYLDTLLALTAEWRRLLAPHGSIAVELGDTYAGSGGAGGDYGDGGFRDGQERFNGAAAKARAHAIKERTRNPGPGWPLDKSLTGIPTLYAWCLAYGRNLLTGEASPAGRWRVRNVKPWIRSNPPVGALGDKERPATSYITVACTSSSRWFDLDAVRTPSPAPPRTATPGTKGPNLDRGDLGAGNFGVSPGGAPPLDWWHRVDAVIDTVIDQRAGKVNGATGGGHGAARGVHIRRALTEAGLLPPGDYYDVSPRGYAGAHYAVWPPELVRLLVDEMCPMKVCTVCGEPSRRITVDRSAFDRQPELAAHIKERREALGITSAEVNGWFGYKEIAKNWERTDKHGAAIPNANDWPVLAERLVLDRERFDDLVLGERHWAESTTEHVQHGTNGAKSAAHREGPSYTHRTSAIRSDLGWSDCGHNKWRPGRILDPFSGSGTTLAVASGMARDSVGIDLDPRNADLTVERVGMFLEVDYGTKEATA